MQSVARPPGAWVALGKSHYFSGLPFSELVEWGPHLPQSPCKGLTWVPTPGAPGTGAPSWWAWPWPGLGGLGGLSPEVRKAWDAWLRVGTG